MAAVIGRDFDLDVLSGATTRPDDAVLDILDAAIAAALVRELADIPGHYSFAPAAEAPSSAVDARSKVSQLKGLMAQQQAAMDEIDLLLRS